MVVVSVMTTMTMVVEVLMTAVVVVVVVMTMKVVVVVALLTTTTTTAVSDVQARLCKCRTEWLSDMLSTKAGASDLTEFKAAVSRQLHNFIHKRMPSVPAGVKR